jgi:nucleoside-diphosphate-sugar epimerase
LFGTQWKSRLNQLVSFTILCPPIDNSIFVVCAIQTKHNHNFAVSSLAGMNMVGVGNTIASILVIGATGNTGKHVVRQLLDQGQPVNVIVRSKQRMLDILPVSTEKQNHDSDLLSIKETSILDMSADDMENSVRDVKAVICCLGHNMDFKGIFGDPKRLVTDSVKNITKSLMNVSAENKNNPPKKFILMLSDGVIHPDGTDSQRSLTERILLSLIRILVPPHADNEEAAIVVYELGRTSPFEWTVVRPTNLINNENSTGNYITFDKPQNSLFGDAHVTRSNVARFMIDLINQDELWDKWKFQFPVIHDAVSNKDTPKDL